MTIWLWYERSRSSKYDPAASALEGMNNLFGSLSWAPQLLKASPKQSFSTLLALGVLDVLSYPSVCLLTWIGTTYNIVTTLR
jgi:hypothetical protein